jgi:hypothetical protein
MAGQLGFDVVAFDDAIGRPLRAHGRMAREQYKKSASKHRLALAKASTASRPWCSSSP